MKTLVKILVVQLCCLPLVITDAMARDGGDRKRDSGGKSRSDSRPASRPASRPSASAKRNPITQSKPANRPAAKPQAPAKRPDFKPNRPETKPANRPNLPDRPDSKPNRPESKPADRPNIPNRPESKPADRPNIPNRPESKPADRPNIPNRPESKPANRPETKPAARPDLPARPGGNRPSNRPETLPGNVKYPKPGRPTTLPGNVNRPPDKRPGQNTRPIKKPNFDRPDNITNVNIDKSKNVKNTHITNKQNNRWWDSGSRDRRPGTTNNFYRGGDTNIRINNNFRNNANWSTNRNNWGYNPWWNRPATRPWYGGSWNAGWNHNYHHHHSHYRVYRPMAGYGYYDDDDNDVAEAIGWGLVGWSLGKLIYDSGYQTYSNPYPAQPVASATGTQVTYTQPITVVAAQSAPDDDTASRMTEVSESYVAASQDAFKQNDYLLALESANQAVGEAPGDGALHEYRALVLFALGKYSEAAGVLNPVLAGGPGWDWTTMISLYNSQETYLSQLAALEKYSQARPTAADARFLLGYHYMVCGALDKASAEFAAAAKLQPADGVSAQLRDLTAASSANGDDDTSDDAEQPAAETPPPTPVPLEKLTGTWVANKGDKGTISLAFKDDGKFIWTYTNGGKTSEFGGEYSMNDNGLLVLDAEESQMVASVGLPQDNTLKFVLAGGPPGDPGLTFAK